MTNSQALWNLACSKLNTFPLKNISSILNLGVLMSQMIKSLQCGRPEFSPWVGKIPWRREWLPTPVFCLENSVDRGAWNATVHGVTKSWTQLSDWTEMTIKYICGMIKYLWKPCILNSYHYSHSLRLCFHSPCLFQYHLK